jgi:hypothetical protein
MLYSIEADSSIKQRRKQGILEQWAMKIIKIIYLSQFIVLRLLT